MSTPVQDRETSKWQVAKPTVTASSESRLAELQTAVKALEADISTLKAKHQTAIKNQYESFVQKENEMIQIILQHQLDKARQRDRVRVLQYQMEQISESAQTAVSSSQARELNALNEGLQYKLEKLALESEFDELCNARLAGEKKGADKDQ